MLTGDESSRGVSDPMRVASRSTGTIVRSTVISVFRSSADAERAAASAIAAMMRLFDIDGVVFIIRGS